MLRYMLLNNFQNSNRYTEWTREDLLVFILPSSVHTRGLALFTITEKSGNQIWRKEGITDILKNAQSNVPNVFDFCFVLFCLFVEYKLVRLLSKSQIHGIVFNKRDIGAVTPKTR